MIELYLAEVYDTKIDCRGPNMVGRVKADIVEFKEGAVGYWLPALQTNRVR